MFTERLPVDHLFKYTGRLFDEATGLQNNLNRWYDPEVGRWLSEDPIGFAGGDENLYRYCGNDPVNWIDPSGLQTPKNAGDKLVVDDAGRECKQSELGTIHLRVDAPAKSPQKVINDTIDLLYKKSGSKMNKFLWAFMERDFIEKEIYKNGFDPGHAFIVIKSPHRNLDKNNKIHMYAAGFYPSRGGNLLFCKPRHIMDINHTYTIEHVFRASPVTMRKVISEWEVLRKKGTMYSFLDREQGNMIAHCTSYAVEVLDRAGLNIYLKPGHFCDPYDLARHIEKRQKAAASNCSKQKPSP